MNEESSGPPIDDLILEHEQSAEDFGVVLLRASRRAVKSKRAKVRFPEKEHEDVKQEVCLRALPRLRKWRPGGRFTIDEFAYVACSLAMQDIAKERSRRFVSMKQDPLDCEANFGTDFILGTGEAVHLDLDKEIRRIRGNGDDDSEQC